MVTYLSKQEAPDANPKVIQQIYLTGNLECTGLFFIIRQVKESILDFS